MKDRRQKEKRVTDGWMASPMQWTMDLGKPREMVRDREACRAVVHRAAKSHTRLGN